MQTVQGKPLALAREPALPSSRVSEDLPFTDTEIDFAHPSTPQPVETPKKCTFVSSHVHPHAVHLEIGTEHQTMFKENFRKILYEFPVLR